MNTFDNPDVVKTVPFKKAALKKRELTVDMPPMSIVSITLK